MFAATLQPSWPSRPQTKGTLLFYFLKLYNFVFFEIFVGSTSSEVQHLMESLNQRRKPKMSRKNQHFQAHFEVLRNHRSLKISAIAIILNIMKLVIKILFVNKVMNIIFLDMEASNIGHWYTNRPTSWKIDIFFTSGLFKIFRSDLSTTYQNGLENLKNFY